ncbi:MAG: hypothetical protein LC650_00160 [Actinobacteria bacterium]|nr:hypothetical protein [Actinomycetota bacterium]
MSKFKVMTYYRGAFEKSVILETQSEAEDYIRRQGDEPGVEYVITEH